MVGAITHEELAQTLQANDPDNLSRSSGLALVSLQTAKEFEEAHIPRSIHLERGREQDVLQHFDTQKSVVLYAQAEFDADAERSVSRLQELGFSSLLIYEPGLVGWQAADAEVRCGEGDRISEVDIVGSTEKTRTIPIA